MDEMHDLRPRGLFIPLELFNDNRLSHPEKFAVVLIDMLDNGLLHCYASNGYLAEKLGVTRQSLANFLTNLRECGWVIDLPPAQGKNRRLTTPLREVREKLGRVSSKTVTQKRNGHSEISEEPVTYNSNDGYLNKYEPVTYNSKIIKKEELEYLEREKINKSGDEERNQALDLYTEFFPGERLNLFQQDIVQTEVTDIEVWRAVLVFWKGNDHRGRSIARMLDKYKQDVEAKANPTLEKSRVVINDFDKCPICENGFQKECPEHGGQQPG